MSSTTRLRATGKSVTEWTEDEIGIAQAASTEIWKTWLDEPDESLADFIKTSHYTARNEWFSRAGYIGAVNHRSQVPDQIVVFKPEHIRVPWARFDPRKTDSADLLAQSNAPRHEGDLHGSLPFGNTALDVWNAMSLDEQRPYHEKWAEAFELYVMEGRAPSAQLQPMFSRMATWLAQIYQSLTSFMEAKNVRLDDEVRELFGRLLSESDDEDRVRESPERMRG